MRKLLIFLTLICFMTGMLGGCARNEEKSEMTELLSDSKFENKFGVMDITNLSGYKIVNELDLLGRAKSDFTWRFAQWGTKPEYSFENIVGKAKDNLVVYENDGKIFAVDVGMGKVSMTVKGENEYDSPREAMGMWPHTLLEEVFRDTIKNPHKVSEYKTFNMELDFEIVACEKKMSDEEFNEGLHTAQVSWYITLNSTKPGVNEYIWFGLPLYDYRSKDGYLDGYIGIDKGTDTGTGMMIYSIKNKQFLKKPVKVGEKNVVSVNIIPYLEKALVYAQENGFLENHTLNDFIIGSTNLGWEVPGTFNATMDINKISMNYNLK